MERARTAIKRKALEAPDKKPNKLVCTEAVKYDSLNYRDVSALTKSFYRIRSKTQPNLPTKIEDVFSALGEFNFSDLGALQLLSNDSDNRVIMLGNQKGLQHLAESDHILGDGTFKYCTNFFLQLYTFHAFGANKIYVPCVFFLVTDKSQKTYTKMLELIQEKTSETGISSVPLNFHVDMEVSMLNAIRSRHPHARIRICHFHLA